MGMFDEEYEAVEEVRAETMEPPRTTSGADRWLAERRDRVAAIAEEYATAQDALSTADDYRQAKRTRAALRKEIAAIDAERKAMTRDVEEAVRRFRDGARDVLAPLSDLDARYRALVEGYEEAVVGRRRMDMAEAYRDMAPALAGLVPFGRLCDAFAEEGRWFRFSTKDQAAMEDMEARVSAIAEGERTVRAMPWASDEDRDAAVSRFFEVLDVGRAVADVQAEAERRARVRELEEARRASAEAPAAPGPEEAPEAREEAPERPEQQAPEPPARRTYVFEFELDEGELADLMAFLRARGIHGRRRAVR